MWKKVPLHMKWKSLFHSSATPPPLREGKCARSAEKGAQDEKIRQKIGQKRGKSKKNYIAKNGEVKLGH